MIIVYLVGGWTNPIEKYDRQSGNHLPNFRGENKKCVQPPSPKMVLFTYIYQQKCYIYRYFKSYLLLCFPVLCLWKIPEIPIPLGNASTLGHRPMMSPWLEDVAPAVNMNPRGKN